MGMTLKELLTKGEGTISAKEAKALAAQCRMDEETLYTLLEERGIKVLEEDAEPTLDAVSYTHLLAQCSRLAGFFQRKAHQFRIGHRFPFILLQKPADYSMYAKASPAIPCRCVHEVRPAQGRS